MFIKVRQKVLKEQGQLLDREPEFYIQEGFINYNLIAAVASDDKSGAYVQMTSGQTMVTIEDPARIFEKIEYVKTEGLVAALAD